MESNFHKMHREYEEKLPPELEHHVTQQVNNLTVFGKVVELFIPNALQTAARLIGGDGTPHHLSSGRESGGDDWRRPPVY